MAGLTKEQILAAQDLKSEVVAVPEWGGEVRLRSMTGADRDAYEQSLVEARGEGEARRLANVRARLVAFCAVDEAGARLFSEADVEALGAKSAAALDRLFEACTRLNRIGASDVEALAKN